jgi:Fe-S cluster assembly protein SufD
MSATTETAPYRAAFDAQPRAGEPSWLAERRRTAIARFEALGLPSRRDEAWRFSDLKPLRGAAFTPAVGVVADLPDLRPWFYPHKTHRIVLVDGRLVPDAAKHASLPRGAYLAGTAQTIAEEPALIAPALTETDTLGAQPFAALNAALFGDGFVLVLEPGVVLDHPIEIVHLGKAPQHASHLRNFVQLGEGSHATLIETFLGGADHWTNAVDIIELGANAVLRHGILQDEASSAIHLGQARARLARGARYESFNLSLGGGLARHEIFVSLSGEGAACGLLGANLLRGTQESTIATFVDHEAPGCATREYFKCVADERAHGVFLGRIAVRPDAQKTDANQLNKNLLLSPRANVDTKPELEILADDVKCSHGATVGDLDEQALFYLEARGIPADEARRMLIEAFAADAIDQIEDDAAMRDFFSIHLRRWLGRDARIKA